jgi:hypothetical protein
VDTGSRAVHLGRIMKTVEVRTNDPDRRIILLGVSGEVVR